MYIGTGIGQVQAASKSAVVLIYRAVGGRRAHAYRISDYERMRAREWCEWRCVLTRVAFIYTYACIYAAHIIATTEAVCTPPSSPPSPPGVATTPSPPPTRLRPATIGSGIAASYGMNEAYLAQSSIPLISNLDCDDSVSSFSALRVG